MSERQTDYYWNILFEKYDILEQIDQEGYYVISAKDIKKEREPRLMVKFDHSINLPHIFEENALSILPVSRGDYIIGHFDTYHKFEPDCDDIITFQIPDYIESIDFRNIPSEAIALNCAVASGILADFVEDECVIPTVSGRMGSGIFKFDIRDVFKKGSYGIQVENSQIEIDAAYEGLSFLSLVEAKLDLSDDFLIRQLYYPFRTWQNRIQKPVKTVFMTYSNGIYRLNEYRFKNPDDYSSIKLVKQCKYSVEDIDINISDIEEVLKTTDIFEEPKIPFPQANSFERVINLCEIIEKNGILFSEQITETYAFDNRQTGYYTNAAMYLGLVDKRKGAYKLSDLGKRVMSHKYKKRQLMLCKCILQHQVFSIVLGKYLDTGIIPGKNEIADIMKYCKLYKMDSPNTYERRASSVQRWIEWIVSLI